MDSVVVDSNGRRWMRLPQEAEGEESRSNGSSNLSQATTIAHDRESNPSIYEQSIYDYQDSLSILSDDTGAADPESSPRAPPAQWRYSPPLKTDRVQDDRDSAERRADRNQRIWRLGLRMFAILGICAMLWTAISSGWKGGHVHKVTIGVGGSEAILDDDTTFTRCPGQSAYRIGTRTFLLNAESFKLSESTKRRAGVLRSTDINGLVTVQGVSNSDEVRVDFAISATDEDLKDSLKFAVDEDDGHVDLKVDLTSSPYIDKPSCMTVNIVVSVPVDKELDSFKIDLETLNLVLDSSVAVTGEEAALSLDVGNLKSEHAELSFDKVSAHLLVGSIEGTFELFDRLVLQTQSGSIDVVVEPKKADKGGPDKKSFYKASTTSGSIHSEISPKDPAKLPQRNYTTIVEAVSGSIQGSYLLSHFTKIGSISGSIKTEIIPVITSKAEFVTESKHGSTKIEFSHPLVASPVFGKHSAVSGSIEAVYPDDYEGLLGLKSATGSVDITGEGVEIISRRKGWTGEVVKAYKGDKGKGNINVQTVTGHVKLAIGDS